MVGELRGAEIFPYTHRHSQREEIHQLWKCALLPVPFFFLSLERLVVSDFQAWSETALDCKICLPDGLIWTAEEVLLHGLTTYCKAFPEDCHCASKRNSANKRDCNVPDSTKLFLFKTKKIPGSVLLDLSFSWCIPYPGFTNSQCLLHFETMLLLAWSHDFDGLQLNTTKKHTFWSLITALT